MYLCFVYIEILFFVNEMYNVIMKYMKYMMKYIIYLNIQYSYILCIDEIYNIYKYTYNIDINLL